MIVAVALFPHIENISCVDNFSYGGMNRISNHDINKRFADTYDIAQMLMSIEDVPLRAIYHGKPYNPPFSYDLPEIVKYYDKDGSLITELLPTGYELEDLIQKTDALLQACKSDDLIILNASDCNMIKLPDCNRIIVMDCWTDTKCDCIIISNSMLMEQSGGDIVLFVKNLLDQGIHYVIIIKESICLFMNGSDAIPVSHSKLLCCLSTIATNISEYNPSTIFDLIREFAD